jgi:MYXO-CTERM domain-containing protein
MNRFFGFALVGGLALASWAQAALVTHYQMNQPTPLAESVPGVDPDRPDLTDPGPTNSPTHLATGGVSSSGAYSFDGTDDYLGFAGSGYTFFSSGTTPVDFTISFWIKTLDAAPSTGYAGTPQVPVLGDTTSTIGFGLGVDNGVAAWRHYIGSWESINGTIPVADGQGHFVTFAFDNAGFLNIYVDGQADGPSQAIYPYGYTYLARSIGRSYGPQYANAIIDDIRVYDTTLTQSEIRTELGLPIPEPASLALAGLGGLALLRRKRGTPV